MQPLKKIVVIGPESTGKSTLCEQLAGHFDTLWCREYAREYLLSHGTDYTYNNLLDIAKGQLILEDQTAAHAVQKFREKLQARPPLIFIDTDMYVMKVWCEFVFNQCHQWIIDQIATRHYDLYLLCNTDLPWVKDELREYPDPETRERLYLMYRDIMINQATPWVNISGDDNGRFEMAVQAVKLHLDI